MRPTVPRDACPCDTTDRGVCILEALGAMAFLAGNARVEADEGEARDVVIEVDLLAPTGLFVASRGKWRCGRRRSG